MIDALLSQFWVQRLGWTLLHFLWQGTVIALGYAILRNLLARSLLSAQGRYVLACGALLAMVIAPPLTFLVIPSASSTSSWTISAAESQRLLPAVVALWMLGSLTFSIRLLGGWRFTARMRSTAHPAPTEWQQTLQGIAARAGVNRPMRLLVSSLVDVPTVLGWLRPVILLPVEFFTGLSFEHITALLAHELAHIRRHDYFVSVLQSIAESVLFYHPAVWWVSEQVRHEREMCCDDLAVATIGDVLAYARALAVLESRQPARLAPALAANGGSLVNRIRRLIEPAHAISNSLPGPGAAWAMTLLWLAGIGVAAIQSTPTPPPVVNIFPLPLPAPSALVALAGNARTTLLYDPLLAAQPMQARRTENSNVRSDSEKAGTPRHDARKQDILRVATPNQTAALIPINATEEHEQKPQLTAEIKPGKTEAALIAKTGDNVPALDALAAAQQVPVPASPEELPPVPTFRSATRLVQVDVVARRKGAPATGLTADDFALLDNGRPQKIASFSVSSSQTPAAAPMVPLPAGAVSNRLEGNGEALANATVLLIDRTNTAEADQAFVIQRVAKFLRTRRNKDRRPDRIGIYTFNGDSSLEVVQEITDDAALLRRAVESLQPRSPGDIRCGGMAMKAHVCWDARTLDTKHMLESMARHLASVPGRKGLIWITSFGALPFESGFNQDVEEAASALNDADVALYPVDARGLVGALSGMTAISNAESREATSAGPLPPLAFARLMQNTDGFPAGTNSVSQVAELTGGLALYNSNAIEDLIRKALDDAELTYTLSFYPAEGQQEGVWHKLKVEVAKPGVRVRYRQRYFASRTLVGAPDHPTLPELLNDPLDATQLRLVAETTPDRARPDFRNVRLSVDLHDVHLENQNDVWAGAVDVSFFREGSRTGQRITRNVEIPDGQLAAALKTGIEVEDSIGVDGQTAELRIVAQDRSTGAAGSVRISLNNR